MNGNSPRILALDVGDARIGVAVSDETLLIARTVGIVRRKDGDPVARVAALVREHSAGRIVVGLPRNMDGTSGPQARKVQNFAAQLQAAVPDVEIAYWDERLSSREAQAIVIRSGARKQKRAQPQDDVAAAVILQAYLDHLRAVEK